MFDYDNDVSSTEKQDHETEKQPPTPQRRKSHIETTNSIANSLYMDGVDGDIKMQHASVASTLSDPDDLNSTQSTRKTSFATLPNTTTWQQQSVNYQKHDLPCKHTKKKYVNVTYKNENFIRIFLLLSILLF